MALFKILKGNSTNLSTQPFVDGYAYFTPDDGRFYIDTQLDTAPNHYFSKGTVNGKNIYRIEIESGTWAELNDTKKNLQAAVADPAASGTGITYISSITQDKYGVISATKSTVRSATTGQTGVVQLNDAINSTSTTTAATANAAKKAYDIGAAAIPKSIGTAAGDIIYWSTAGTPVRLAKGSDGQVLKLSGGVPTWAADNNTNTDTLVSQTATNTNANYEVLFSGTADNTTRTEGARKYSNLLFNPSTGLLTATSFSGSGASLTSLNASNISSGTLSADRLATSGATAGSYGDSAAQTPGYGATFKVPYITVDNKGRVTGISEHTVKIPASDNTNTDTLVTQTATTTNAAYEVLFSATADNTTRTETARKNTNLKFNPSTGQLNTTKVQLADAVTLQYNTTTKSLDFIFA